MRYYVETIVWRNGVEYWSRNRLRSYEEAKAVAQCLAEEAFREQVNVSNDYQMGQAPTFENDFGEMMLIRATAFGEMANVREGAFVID
jgi:hypothetical protein